MKGKNVYRNTSDDRKFYLTLWQEALIYIYHKQSEQGKLIGLTPIVKHCKSTQATICILTQTMENFGILETEIIKKEKHMKLTAKGLLLVGHIIQIRKLIKE